MLTLYYARQSCALATHIALEDASADYIAKRVDFKKEEQRKPDYLAINPKGRVPALITPEGVLTETPAMLVYVAQTHPSAALAPLDDPFALAKLQEFNSYICSTLHVAHAHGMRGYRWADGDDAHQAMRRKVPESVGACYAYLEEHVLDGPFVMGAQYTIADPYLFTVAQWMETDGLDPKDFPKTTAHRDMMRERASVKAALAAEFAEEATA